MGTFMTIIKNLLKVAFILFMCFVMLVIFKACDHQSLNQSGGAATQPVTHGSSYPSEVRAVLHSDPGTSYVFTNEASGLGGQCVGKKRVYVAPRRGSYYSGLSNLMCWEEYGDSIMTITEDGSGNQITALSLFDFVQ